MLAVIGYATRSLETLITELSKCKLTKEGLHVAVANAGLRGHISSISFL